MNDAQRIAELEERLRNSIDAANRARGDLHYAIAYLADIERHCIKRNRTGEVYRLAYHALNELGVVRHEEQKGEQAG